MGLWCRNIQQLDHYTFVYGERNDRNMQVIILAAGMGKRLKADDNDKILNALRMELNSRK